MNRRRSIAVGQTVPAAGDVGANVAAHLRAVRAAAAAGAEVVVFPELSLTGYEMTLAASLAFTEDDARVVPLADAAAADAITIVAGAPVRLGDRLYIAAFVLRPDGSRLLYTKHRLGVFSPGAAVDGTIPPAESTVFAPGDRNPLVGFDSHTTALAICADIVRPSHADEAAARGAHTVLAGVFLIPSDFPGDSEKFRMSAARNHMAAALANFGGPSGGMRSAGCSSIWSPSGDLLVELPESGAAVGVATETAEGWHTCVVAVR